MKLLLLSIFVALLFTSCATTNKEEPSVENRVKNLEPPKVFRNLNYAISELGNQLFINNIVQQDTKKIVLTSFVNLESFKETSTFGRVSSESMINELHIRNFKVLDYRGQSNLSMNKTGEFHITRDIKRIKSKIDEAFVLVGTYSKFNYESVMINARIMDILTGDVISTGRVIYMVNDCSLFNSCKEDKSMKIIKDY